MNAKTISDYEGNFNFYLNISLFTYLFTMNNLPKLTAHRGPLMFAKPQPTVLVNNEKQEYTAARLKLQSYV